VLGKRRFRVGFGVWLVCCVVLWNVVFDGKVQSAEERYLKAAAAENRGAPVPGARAVMEPAVRRAAAEATEWTLVTWAGGIAVLLCLSRRSPVTGSSSASSAPPSSR
jgi:hypothetical protein